MKIIRIAKHTSMSSDALYQQSHNFLRFSRSVAFNDTGHEYFCHWSVGPNYTVSLQWSLSRIGSS